MGPKYLNKINPIFQALSPQSAKQNRSVDKLSHQLCELDARTDEERRGFETTTQYVVA